jgi:PII-like signaling protein
MTQSKMTMVRIYLTEGDHQLRKLLEFLQQKEHVRGVTAFRGIAGFGPSGKLHESSLLDISLDLPLVVEFFDQPERAEKIKRDLHQWVGPGHIVSWTAQTNTSE